jgi:hypothetical protein
MAPIDDDSDDDVGNPNILSSILFIVNPDSRGNLRIIIRCFMDDSSIREFIPNKIEFDGGKVFPIRNRRRISHHDLIWEFLSNRVLQRVNCHYHVMSIAFSLSTQLNFVSFTVGQTRYEYRHQQFGASIIVDYCFVKTIYRRILLRNQFFLLESQKKIARTYPYISVLHSRYPGVNAKENLRRNLVRIANRRGYELPYDGLRPPVHN